MIHCKWEKNEQHIRPITRLDPSTLQSSHSYLIYITRLVYKHGRATWLERNQWLATESSRDTTRRRGTTPLSATAPLQKHNNKTTRDFREPINVLVILSTFNIPSRQMTSQQQQREQMVSTSQSCYRVNIESIQNIIKWPTSRIKVSNKKRNMEWIEETFRLLMTNLKSWRKKTRDGQATERQNRQKKQKLLREGDCGFKSQIDHPNENPPSPHSLTSFNLSIANRFSCYTAIPSAGEKEGGGEEGIKILRNVPFKNLNARSLKTTTLS